MQFIKDITQKKNIFKINFFKKKKKSKLLKKQIILKYKF